MLLKKTALSLVLILLYIFSSMFALPANASWNVWLDHSIKKYRQNGEDGTSGSQSHSMKMARNEFESFQVLIYANGENLNNVDVNVSSFTKGSDTITDIYLYKEWYVNCSQNSRIEYETGYYPDALLPKVDRYYNETRTTFPFKVASGKVQGVWIDVGTETATVPGMYTATVTISADGKADVNLPVTLEVFDFELPSTSNFPANYILRVSNVSFGHGYERIFYNDPAKSILDQYMKMFLYNRAVPVIRGDGWSMTYTWDNVAKTLTINTYDPYESWLRPGMDGTAITSGPLKGAKFPVIHISNYDRPNTDNGIANVDRQNAVRQYYQQQYDRALSNGWNPFNKMYNSVIDEPDCSTNVTFRGETMTMCEQAYLQATDTSAIDTHGAGELKNVFIHSTNQKEELTDFENYGFYAPNIATLACANWDRECSSRQPSGGTRDGYKDYPYWSYLGCSSNGCRIIGNEHYSGAMDSSVDAVGMYFRPTSFYRYLTRATGSFFWGVDVLYASNDIYNDMWSSEYSSNGDGSLLYYGITSKSGRTWTEMPGNADHAPEIGGTHDIPIASIRWKYIRDQQEDLEYFKLAEESTNRATVVAIVDNVFNDVSDPKFAYWNLNMDPSTLLNARISVAGLITGGSSRSLIIEINTPLVQ